MKNREQNYEKKQKIASGRTVTDTGCVVIDNLVLDYLLLVYVCFCTVLLLFCCTNVSR